MERGLPSVSGEPFVVSVDFHAPVLNSDRVHPARAGRSS